VNSSEDIRAAFKTFYETAELDGVTDPNLVYDLRAKLDASGHHDHFEVDRLVAVEMNPTAEQGISSRRRSRGGPSWSSSVRSPSKRSFTFAFT
jgi:hypothetical protein